MVIENMFLTFLSQHLDQNWLNWFKVTTSLKTMTVSVQDL